MANPNVYSCFEEEAAGCCGISSKEANKQEIKPH